MSSSESESSLSGVEDRNGSDMDSSSESEFGAIASVFQPYMDEPLAPLRQGHDQDDGDEEAARQDENVDTYGLSRQELEARYEKEKPVGDWCTCTKCKDDILVGSREFRCCREVAEAYGKVVFEGLQDTCVCVIQHDDFAAVTNTTNLKMVAPLLKDREGKKYRKKADQTENEFLRAVAYRWLARWLYGYLGWDNTRVLPACIYNYVQTKYPSQQQKGYAATNERT